MRLYLLCSVSGHEHGFDGGGEEAERDGAEESGLEAGAQAEQAAGGEAREEAVVEVCLAAIRLDVALEGAEDDAEHGEVLARRPGARAHLDGDLAYRRHLVRIDGVHGIDAGREYAEDGAEAEAAHAADHALERTTLHRRHHRLLLRADAAADQLRIYLIGALLVGANQALDEHVEDDLLVLACGRRRRRRV